MLGPSKEFKEVKIISATFWYIFTMFLVILIPILLGFDNLLKNDNLLTLLSSLLFIAVLLFKFRISRDKFFLLFKDYRKKVNLKELLGVVGTQLCLSMGISLLTISFIYFNSPDLLDGILNESAVSSYYTYSGMFVAMLITVVCAPISEELFFRAIIFKRTSKKFNIYIGMIVSSLIFGLLHIELAIIGAFLFGVSCCILYAKYKNILITMTLHFLNNLIAFLPQLNLNSSTDNTPLTSSDAYTYFIMGSVLFLIGMFFFIKFIIKNKSCLKNNNFNTTTLPSNTVN